MSKKREPLYQLSQVQLDALVPVFNRRLNGELRTKKQMYSAFREACEKANCPIPSDVDMDTVVM